MKSIIKIILLFCLYTFIHAEENVLLDREKWFDIDRNNEFVTYEGFPLVVEVSVQNNMEVVKNEKVIPYEEIELLDPKKRREYSNNIFYNHKRLLVEDRAFVKTNILTQYIPYSFFLIFKNGEKEQTKDPHELTYFTQPLYWIEETRKNHADYTKPSLGLKSKEKKSVLIYLNTQIPDLYKKDITKLGVILHNSYYNPGYKSIPQNFQPKPVPKKDKNILKTAYPIIHTMVDSLITKDIKTIITSPIKIDELLKKLSKPVLQELTFWMFLTDLKSKNNKLIWNENLLKLFPVKFKHIADCFRYECLLSNGKKEEAEKIYKKVSELYPEVKWRVDDVKVGKGLLLEIMKLKRKT